MVPLRLTLIPMFFSALATASDVKVVLTGNTYDLKYSSDLFGVMERYCSNESVPLLWVLNGDIFPASFDEEKIITWQREAIEMLEKFPQLQILITQGDRDWDDSGKSGWKKIQSLEKILRTNKHQRLHLFIKDGCPGPWTFSFSPTLDMVIINSQWWNHSFEKPTAADDVCSIADTDIFIEELEGILDDSGNKNIMILSHFPLESLGNYGGRFPISAYLSPPIVGSAIVGFHQNVGNSKDIRNPQFEAFRSKLTGVLQNYSSLIYASAHEHNQSIIKAGQNYYVNSGALTGKGFIATPKQALLASSKPGLIEITYKESGEVSYQFIESLNNKLEKINSGPLISAHSTDSISGAERIRSKPSEKNSTDVPNKLAGSKTTHAIAGSDYASSSFKEFWLGRHYRASWTKSVEVPYLNMDSAYDGLVVMGKGGGRQTTSLKLSGGDGQEYVFRSVNKDPSKALPYELRGTLVSEVLKDQTTTQQPYGALAVSYWLEKVHILHASPTLYVMPDDDALGSFRSAYRGLFGMLEVRPTDKIAKDKVFGGAKDIEKSYKMFDKLYHDHDNRVADLEFVRARIFDMWVGDWSKHEDNWKWAGFKDKTGEIFRPIPRDRDHAFSRWDGVIPWLGDRAWAMPNGENFDEHIKGLRSLNWQARHLDRFVTNEVTRDQWINAAREIQASISEKDIEDGVRQMPLEIYKPDGLEIEKKLKARINDLPHYAEQYYTSLSREVEVVGSNKKEYFHVLRNEDGSVKVTVSDIDKEQKPDLTKVYYERTFYPNETKEIRLFGLLDDDAFLLEGKAQKSILVRVIGGEGKEVIIDQSMVDKGSSKTKIYEKDENSKIDLGSEGRNIAPKDERFYHYDRTNFKYNTYLPIALVTYNPFTGFAVQGGVTFTQQRFSKPDFSAKHRIRASVSTEGNYELSYANQFRYLVAKWDGISEIVLSRPFNFNYFFGVGNNTVQDDERSSDYYRAQYNLASITAGLTRSIWQQSRLSFVASYELVEGIERNDSYLADHPDVFGVGKLNIFFLKGALDIDFRDRPALPEHGFRFLLDQYGGHISDAPETIASITEVEVENYFSTYTKNPLTLGLRLGGGTTHGQLPFYKLLSLGQLNNLQGFKRNRFTGDSRAFFNSELRWQITETRNTFIPLKIGIRGFYDIGRVWSDTDDESADYWHYGYGGGFYVTPFREQFSFNISAGRSKEESMLLMISVGSFFR